MDSIDRDTVERKQKPINQVDIDVVGARAVVECCDITHLCPSAVAFVNQWGCFLLHCLTESK